MMASGLLCCTQKPFVPTGFLRTELEVGTWEVPGATQCSFTQLFFIGVIAVWKQACNHRNCHSDFYFSLPYDEETYILFQINQTFSKLPAWRSEQRVKGWNRCLSWTAALLWPQRPLLETQGTHCFLLRELDAALPGSMLPGRGGAQYLGSESGPTSEKSVWFHLTSSHQTHPMEHLIWAQPFMDRHLVILHLYCLCVALPSRISYPSYHEDMIYKTQICNKGVGVFPNRSNGLRGNRRFFWPHIRINSNRSRCCCLKTPHSGFKGGCSTLFTVLLLHLQEQQKELGEWDKFWCFLALSQIISHHWRHVMLRNSAIKSSGNSLWVGLWNLTVWALYGGCRGKSTATTWHFVHMQTSGNGKTPFHLTELLLLDFFFKKHSNGRLGFASIRVWRSLSGF